MTQGGYLQNPGVARIRQNAGFSYKMYDRELSADFRELRSPPDFAHFHREVGAEFQPRILHTRWRQTTVRVPEQTEVTASRWRN